MHILLCVTMSWPLLNTSREWNQTVLEVCLHAYIFMCVWLASPLIKCMYIVKNQKHGKFSYDQKNQTYNNILLKVTGGWSLLCIFALCLTVAMVRWLLLLLCIFMYLCHVLDRAMIRWPLLCISAIHLMVFIVRWPFSISAIHLMGAMVRWLVKSTLSRKIIRVHKESTAKEQSWEGQEVWWPTLNTCWGV